MSLKIHKLKTWPPYFQDTLDGKKPFEVRKDDRDFGVGDFVWLEEWCPVDGKYTGRKIGFNISYKLSGGEFGIEEGYCVLGFIGLQIERLHGKH